MAERYKIGVMKTLVEEELPLRLDKIVDAAVKRVEETLTDDVNVQVEVFEFNGPHLTPVAGAYSPLDFLQLGLSEKLERGTHFLLVTTEVDLSAATLSYVLALPSELTNVGIISAKRLSPTFRGHPENVDLTAARLAALMLHTLGHLLNLSHHPDAANIMYDFQQVEELAQMRDVTPEQVNLINRRMPIDTYEAVASEQEWSFILKQIMANRRAIGRTLIRANPFRLMLQLPTMLTAALSVVIVLFFSAEIWDVASTLEFGSLAIFSIFAVAGATALLHRRFKIDPRRSRSRLLAESTVVTVATIVFSLLLTVLLLYVLFFLLAFVSAATFFPAELKETWPTVDPAVRVTEHVKLGMFLAAMAVLTGSLGGSADSQALIRHVLFLNEET